MIEVFVLENGGSMQLLSETVRNSSGQRRRDWLIKDLGWRQQFSFYLYPFESPDEPEEDVKVITLSESIDWKDWRCFSPDGEVPPAQSGWTLNQGVLTRSAAANSHLTSRIEYSDFEISFDYQISAEANGGIVFWHPLKDYKVNESAFELQIIDDAAPRYRNLSPEQKTGSLYQLIPRRADATKRWPEWNAMTIRADDGQLKVTLNNAIILDADLDEYADRSDGHNIFRKPRRGHITIQNHRGLMNFRNIRLKPVP